MTFFAIGMPGPMEMVIIGVIGFLLFGNRLPGMAYSLGKMIPSFKHGLEDLDVRPELNDAVKDIDKELRK